MNSLFTPKYIRKIKGVYVLWFEKSNKYIVLNGGNMNVVNAYLNSENEAEFSNTLKNSTNTNLKFLFNFEDLMSCWPIRPRQPDIAKLIFFIKENINLF